MLTSADYRDMADRSAQLAIASPAPSVAEALLTLALHYMTQAAEGTSTGQRHRKTKALGRNSEISRS